MHPFIKALLSCLMATVIATTSFAMSTFASPLPLSLSISRSTEVAFISSPTTAKTGKAIHRVGAKGTGKLAQKYGTKKGTKKIDKVILRVAPKVAHKLLKKHGRSIIKILPGVGPAIKLIEISADFYTIMQQELAQDSQSIA